MNQASCLNPLEAGARHVAAVRATVGLTCLALLAGCATPARYAAEVAAARTRAAEARAREDAATEPSAVRIEGRLSLADALKLALQYNKELQASWQEREVARGRVLESYGQALPRLTANAGYTRLDEVTRIDLGGQSVALGFADNYAADLTVRQPLFHGSAIPAALRTARLYALFSDETIRAAVQAVIFQTTHDYYDWLLARELAAVDEQALKFAEALSADVKRKRQSGTASDYDVLRAEVEVSNTRAQCIRSQNARDLALTRLLKTMGVSQHRGVAPADVLSYHPEHREAEAVRRLAQQHRPELLQAEYTLRMQREALSVARSAYAPKLDAFFTEKWANPDPHSSMHDEWGEAWTLGVTVTLPIFDGGERRGRLLQENARLRQAEIRLLAAEETVALDVEQALLNLRDAEELVESQKANLVRAEEGLRLVQAGYRQGVQNELAVLDAQTALTRARALYYQALHGHMLARLNLQRATGTLMPGSSDPAAPPSEEGQKQQP